MSGRSIEGAAQGPKPKEIDPEAFYKQVGRFPVEAQDRISGLSSLQLEADVWERIKQNPVELTGIVTELRGTGLSPVEVSLVFRYFDLPPSQPPLGGSNNTSISD